MASWQMFQASSPELAAAGEARLVGLDGVAIAFLATVSKAGAANIAPVCPVFSGDNLYLVASDHTPKTRDLRANPAFALHAFLGESDEEFQASGTAVEVLDGEERSRVQTDIPFAGFNPNDPIFRFDIAQALWVYWENVGQENTKPVRRTWRENA